MAKILNISGAEITDRGIQKLADYVEANLPDDFTLIIGCKPSIYDVDAVLIGGGNIYAIECKDWKGNIKGGSYGWWKKDGQVIENPLQQARNNSVALGKWLRSKIMPENSLWVKGILVFTHDDIDGLVDVDDNSNTGVSVIHLSELDEWLDGQKHSVGKNELEIVKDFFNRLSKDPMDYLPTTTKNNIIVVNILSCISGLLLILSIIFGILYVNYSYDYIIALITCVIVALITGISAATLSSKTYKMDADYKKVEHPIFECDDHADITYDPLNIYNTYKKP